MLKAPSAQLRLLRQGDRVRARGTYRAGVMLACSRCLEPASFELEGELDWQFLPETEAGETGAGARGMAEELHLNEEELEAVFYREGKIDLGSALRDELALGLPMAPLCRPDCAGLCPDCGRPKGDAGCDCSREEMDPRWAALAKLKQ